MPPSKKRPPRQDSKPAKATKSGSPASPDVTLQANIAGFFGSTGTGKSARVKRLLAQAGADYTIVFDPQHEYEFGRASSDEVAFYQGLAPGVNVFRPSTDAARRARQFDRFCAAGLSIARSSGACLVVVDELHLFTEAGSAPASWNELVLTGRKFGVSIVAASIRPAGINKDFWTCCTAVSSGRLSYEDDQRTIARALGVKPEDIAALPDLHYIERNMRTGETRRGVLTF